MKSSLTTTTKTLAITLIALALAGAAHAAFVASDLNDGGADTGFSDAWHNGSNNVFITEDPDLAYANYGITQAGAPQKIMTSNAGPDRQDVRTLTTAMSGDIWFTVLVNVPAGGNYAGLTLNNYGNSYDPVTTGARILMGDTQLQVGFNGGAASTGTGTYTAGTTHLLLGYMNVVAGNDTLEVWVDPDLTLPLKSTSDLPTANFTSTTVDFAASITDIGAAGSIGTAAEVYSDAYRLSDTATAFEDVTGVEFIPEPSTAILAGIGLAGLCLRRRSE
jgi:hypothetical protein